MNTFANFTSDDFITGEKFQACCDIDLDCRIDGPRKPFVIPDSLKEKPVLKVFVQTHYLNEYLPQIAKITDKKFILVTHNSDGSITKDNPRWYDYQLMGIPENIVHWFCQNCEVENDKLTPIPIALENAYCVPRAGKQRKMIDHVINPKPFSERSNLAFMCGNVWTNAAARCKPYELLRGKPWVKIGTGINGAKSFDWYSEQMANSVFVMSPDGNGRDSVRMWEALYYGCIPIVQRHIFTEYFAQYLPIMIIDKWEEITEDNLNDIKDWYFLDNNLEDRKFEFNMLKMSYWKDKINDYL